MMNIYRLHCGPKSHQERPERITSMTESLNKSNLLSKCLCITKVNPCSYNDLTTTHDSLYIDKLYKLSTEFDDKDNEDNFKFSKDFANVYYNKHSLLSCRISVGSCITMIKHLLSDFNDNRYGVALVRPPGHHCNANTPLDFCLVNNVAVTADYIHTNHPKLKTVILDIDYHHGNGTQDIFYETAKDKNILFMSLHQKNDDKGHFKHTGEHGMNINIPFPFINDIGNYEYYVALMNIVIPILKQYKPDVILISMGFDAVENDNIGRFKLTPKFYALMIWLLIVKCDDRCKIGLILEGGYNLNILPKCIKQTLKALIYSNNNNDKLNIAMINMIRELKPARQRVYDETEKRIIECIQHFSKYWNLSETIVTEI